MPSVTDRPPLPRPVRIHDTLRGEVVPLVPRVSPRVGMFVCGLTPYKPSHLGHGRTFVFFDVVARFLRQQGYRVFYLQNVTDLDDKTLAQAREEGTSYFEVSERNFSGYVRDMERLGVRSVNLYARCTDYVPEILLQIQELMAKGFAYPGPTGDVYYEVSRFPSFGALSRQRMEEVRPGARVEVDPHKRAPEDFVIWKGGNPDEPAWPSPYGPGRPGWHIEDTAITLTVLGPRYEIHGGGVELKFPHHEAEIALAESATGLSPLAQIWMHAGLLNMRGEKMSKSLGNVVGLSETLHEQPPDRVRFFLLSGLYRSPLDFAGEESFAEAARGLERLRAPYDRLRALRADAEGGGAEHRRELPASFPERSERVVEAIRGALAEDFNVRQAVAEMYGWGREVNTVLQGGESLLASGLDVLLEPFRFADESLGFLELREGVPSPSSPGPEIGALVDLALKARESARRRGDFPEADRIREGLAGAGIALEDTPQGPRWKRRGGT